MSQSDDIRDYGVPPPPEAMKGGELRRPMRAIAFGPNLEHHQLIFDYVDGTTREWYYFDGDDQWREGRLPLPNIDFAVESAIRAFDEHEAEAA